MSSSNAFFLRNHVDAALQSLPFTELIAREAKPGDPMHPGQSATKADFTTRHANPATDHVYFSGWEPKDPGLRLTKTNPPAWLHAIVADYDVHGLEQSAVERAIEDAQKTGFPASYASRTYSGGLRLVWVLEKPLAIFNEQLASAFLKRALRELKIAKPLGGTHPRKPMPPLARTKSASGEI